MPPEKVEIRSRPAVLEGYQAQHLVDALVDLGAGDVVEDGVEAEVLLGRQLVVEGLLLEDEPDVAPHRLGLALHVEAVHGRSARRSAGRGCTAS